MIACRSYIPVTLSVLRHQRHCKYNGQAFGYYYGKPYPVKSEDRREYYDAGAFEYDYP